MLKNDLKNDIEKTLQAHCPEPPEGFAERMDNKAISLMQKRQNQNVNKGRSRYRLPVLAVAAALVLCFVTAASRDLIIRPDAIRARETATPLVTVLSEGHGEVTEGEGLSQEAIEALEVNFPGVADKLKPVNLSCEKQGIRMNVISALVEDDKSWVVYSLQDLEGDRISRFAGMDVDLSGNGDDTGYYCYLDHNQEEHKVTCVHYEEYGEPYQPVDNHFAFKVEDIGREQVEKIDILPFLKQYAKTSEGVKAPEDASVYSTQGDVKYAWSVKVLEDTDPLNVSLYKDIYLTGIGWIDDQLHVRIQDRQQEKITIGSMSVYPVFLSAAGYFSETGKECEMDQVEWSSAGDERKDLKEYIFDVRPDEVDKMELAAWADDTVDVTRDVWEVQIPADSILAETENPAATVNAVVENESDVQIKATLWAFFTDWVGQNTNYMLLVCADEWKDRQSDPEQAARELMASRKPDGYIINSISGKDKDPVRTVDLTVQWDAGTYSRHEIPFRLQQVTPQMDAYRVDPDGFETGTEAEPVSKKELVLLTEEEIIRKEISYLEFSYDDLIPINLSMEKQGIRMEVMSGCVKGQDLYILCSLQDLEGRYDGLDMEIEQLFKPDVLRMGYSRPYSNYAENKSFWLFHTEEFAQYQAEDGTIPFGIDMVRFEKDESFDMLPFLEKYGKETEGVNAPENARTLGDKESAEDLKVLDYTNPLDVPLTETAKLAGIGWIDNQLHIQLHTAAENIHTEGGTSFPATSVQVYDPFSSQSGQVVEWDENGDWFNDWYDYGLDIKPEDVEQRWLTAEVRETKGVVDDNWEVQVPINMLLTGSDEDAAVQKEETEAVEGLSLEEQVNRQIEEKWPGITKELKPVNLSCEKQGIRFEVTSALAKGNEAWAVYTLEDITGDRGSPEEGYCVGGYEKDTEGKDPKTETYLLQRAGETGRRQIYVKHIEAKNPLRTEDDIFTVGIKQVCIERYKQIDLIPFLKEYGKNVEGIEMPELHPAFSKTARQGMKILDYTQPLDISLLENVKLTGIGWIDDQLHTQIHFTAEPIRTSDGVGHSGAGVNIHDSVSGEGVVWPLGWDDNGDEFPDWMESVIDVRQEDAEDLRLTAEVWENKEIVDDNWEVQVPIDMLLPETGAEPAAQEEEKTVEPASETQAEPAAENKPAFDAEQYYLDNQLWGYIYCWAGGDVNGMLTYSTSEWKRNTEDPKAYLSGMLENGLPKGIRIDSISGTSADSERTAVCTVQTDRDGTEEYAKYNLIIKREKRGVYYIDSGSLGSREPAEKDPEAEMISLSDESIISRKMERSFPGITEQLKPLNISAEKQGIRLEAVSALVQKQDAWFIFSVEDTENRYPYGITYATVSENTGSQSTYLYSNLLYSNQVEHKNYFVLCPHYSYPVSTVDRDVLLRMTGANAEEDRVWLDMNALIRQYGQTVEGIAAPENTINFMSKTSEDMSGLKVLDYSQPLNIPVCESLTLTGIGWIDGKLHVQFYHRDIDKYISFLGFEQYIPGEKDVYTWYPNSIWYHWEDVNGGWWTEYMIDSFAPDDVDRVCLETEIQQSRNMDIRDNMLAVKIPFSSIWVGDEAGQTWSNAAPKE